MEVTRSKLEDSSDSFGNERSEYFDKHTLYFTTKLLEVEIKQQLVKVLSMAHDLYKNWAESNQPKLTLKYKINCVHNREGKYLDHGYLWVDDAPIYYCLLGKNFDGSERICYKDEVEVTTPEEQSSSEWGDLPEVEEIPMPPLVQLDEIKLVPAFVGEVGENYDPHVLCCRNCPAKLKPEVLKNIFSNFSTSRKTDRGKPVYPLISIRPSKGNGICLAFVTFDSQTLDAQFCLLMTKKLKVENFDEPLSFSQCYRTSEKNFNLKDGRVQHHKRLPKHRRGTNPPI